MIKYILFVFIISKFISNVQSSSNKEENRLKRIFIRGVTCPDSKMCLSKWNYCGYSSDYCGDGCQSGSCTNNNQYFITDQQFKCAFNTLDTNTRQIRLNILRKSNWKPANANEAAVFLSDVYHETDGLRTLTEYCAPSKFYFFEENSL